MSTVFLIWYTSPGSPDESLIGVYASHADALAAVARLKVRAGNDPNCFEIDEYQIGRDHWVPDFSTNGAETRSPQR